jgi:hypothetical protein
MLLHRSYIAVKLLLHCSSTVVALLLDNFCTADSELISRHLLCVVRKSKRVLVGGKRGGIEERQKESRKVGVIQAQKEDKCAVKKRELTTHQAPEILEQEIVFFGFPIYIYILAFSQRL